MLIWDDPSEESKERLAAMRRKAAMLAAVKAWADRQAVRNEQARIIRIRAGSPEEAWDKLTERRVA